jgi:hypothetical protein
VVPQNEGSATYPKERSSGTLASLCRQVFHRIIRVTRVLESLAIRRLLVFFPASDAMDSPRATTPRLCLHLVPARSILSHFFGEPNHRPRRIYDLGTQTAERGNGHRTTAEKLRGRVVLSWFRRTCRGCDLLFWRWEKHDCAACLKRREWSEELRRTLAARWEAARRPPMRDTTRGFVWIVACSCGCRSVELTEEGAVCVQCGMPGPSGIEWPPRSESAN